MDSGESVLYYVFTKERNPVRCDKLGMRQYKPAGKFVANPVINTEPVLNKPVIRDS